MAHFELGYTLIWLNDRRTAATEILVADSLAHCPRAHDDLERLVIGIAARISTRCQARSRTTTSS